MPGRSSGKRRLGGRFVAAVAVAWMGASLAATAAESIRGLPFVADGDTLGFGERRVRLYGIDAPELDQTCDLLGRQVPIGQWAARTLHRLIGRDEVVCYPLTRPTNWHVVGRCHTATIPDLGRAMVEAGFAWDFRRQSHGIYEDDEASARTGKLGVWAGKAACQPPWRWRQR